MGYVMKFVLVSLCDAVIYWRCLRLTQFDITTYRTNYCKKKELSKKCASGSGYLYLDH